MYQTATWREKIRLFIQIFVPILIYQFANFSASFIDTMMTGQYSTVDLAGVSMATSLWNPFFALSTGIVSALVPIIGQHLGSGAKESIRKELHQFIYLALGLALILLLLVFGGAVPILGMLHLEKAVFQVAERYLFYISIGIFPLLLFSVFRSFFDSLGLTRLSMYLMLLIVPFNSFFNYLLIYGRWGLPRLGGAGTGLGTALSYWAVLLIVLMVMYRHPKIKEYQIWKISALDWSFIKEDLRIGLPIGLQIFAEVAIFAVVGLYMSKFSSQVIASHQAAMNFATLLYAFPLSISSALPIVISYEIGAKRYQDVRAYSRLGRLSAFGFASLTLSFLYFFRPMVATLYGHDPAFIGLTSQFLTYALFFQLADAFTAPIQGILRGYKDTTIPFIIGLVSYWSMTFPIAFLLDSRTSLGPFAYWIGLVVGIFICGICLNLRLRSIAKRAEKD
ncbi:MATE family efflux transporter [Streptococcus sp. zg-86]|uniref:Probable multidrug resistance protein NorM n=1 Tax=Streptococcus zhangguiae TaxID=2664091 RepID=A0A6I4RJQ9_9STRE|nr:MULTISPECIES: MATE family efflux transporter [unclassified Streptococcus]MTB64595.1 MATE family efflux transporter [Streptococcus sp. zg-86]MTB90905.1 MATE family efflux transporter [Streptococcus sp. zg-36]MWV56671.1 MATE family efflux transporter [Streptococcus sp. zg-70]QTH48629.1 MATE family efflux transporter [Streptococcus sp. zg-86]